MNIKFNYIDNLIQLRNKVYAIEINNKNYFYRTVNLFNQLSLGYLPAEIFISDNELNEINLSNKVFVVLDYFNLENLFSKYNNSIIKLIAEETDEKTRLKILNNYNKIINDFDSILNNLDLDIYFKNDFNLSLLLKLFKPSIKIKENLLENLFLLIDYEKVFRKHKLMVFINLKQYLTKEEILEFYKYAIYNEVNIILIDSQNYGITLENENKLIIDENLDEIVL